MTSDKEASITASARRSPLLMLGLVALVAFIAGIGVMRAGSLLINGHGRAKPVKQAVAPPAPEPTPAAKTADINQLDAREKDLSNRISGLEGRLDGIDSDSRVASTFATRAEGLMVAFAARRALDRGLPLGYMEDQLRQRFGAVQPRAVATVVQAAHQPVTLEDLRLALDTLSPKLLASGPDESWWDGIRRDIGDLVVLRQESTPSPRPTERLRRARRMLDAGQVEGALAEVARMPGAANAQSWIAAARRYIDARRALDAIEATALEGGGKAVAPATQPVAKPTPKTQG